MSSLSRSRRSPWKIVLWVLLAIALVVLALVAAVLIPIFTHESAGGSGQRVPETYVSDTSAEGADGRTRELSVETTDGQPAQLDDLEPGEELVVRGSGYDSGIGIYVAFCKIPDSSKEKPGPCLGGIPEGAEEGEATEEGLASVWITDDWAWRAFATKNFDDADEGTFTARVTVPEPTVDGVDCRVDRCAIATRADHTATGDRIQDMLLPFAYAE